MVGQSYVASFTMIFVALLMVVLSVHTCRGQDEGESILMCPVNEYQSYSAFEHVLDYENSYHYIMYNLFVSFRAMFLLV